MTGAGHDEMERRLAGLVRAEFRVDRYLVALSKPPQRAWVDFRSLDGVLRLELQFALQQRHDGPLQLSPQLNAVIRTVARHAGRAGARSLTDRELGYWELRLRDDNPWWRPKSAEPPLALLRRAYRDLVDVYDDRDEFDRDVWDLRRLGYTDALLFGPKLWRVSFAEIPQPWLREAAKRWLRLRVHAGAAPSTIRHCRINVTAFALWLHDRGLAVEGPQAITRRDVIEPYVAHVHRSGLKAGTQSRRLADLRAFLDDCRRHDWCAFADDATIYNDELPVEHERLPRFMDEHVMAQIEANLDRLPDEPTRHFVVLLIETGSRVGEICALGFDCVIHDGDGQPYLHYYQPKMRKEHTIPLNERAVATIAAQQAWVRERWPAGSRWLFPRLGVNPDAVFPFVDRTLRVRINDWALAHDIRDSNGRPARITPHRFRHTYGTRMINAGVRHETVQAFYGHETPMMTSQYATIHDSTVKDGFLRYERQRFDARGEPVRFRAGDADADARWLKASLKAQALPNGYCGLPLQSVCPHANACLTCDHFQTDVTFLALHRKQLDETRRIIGDAEQHGHQRQVEMNRHVADNLERLVGRLKTNGSPARESRQHQSTRRRRTPAQRGRPPSSDRGDRPPRTRRPARHVPGRRQHGRRVPQLAVHHRRDPTPHRSAAQQQARCRPTRQPAEAASVDHVQRRHPRTPPREEPRARHREPAAPRTARRSAWPHPRAVTATRTVEAARITIGLETGATPEGIIVRAYGHARGKAAQTEARCREVMLAVISWTPHPPTFPSIDEWRSFLPSWFVDACAPEQTAEEAERWLERWRAAPLDEKTRLERERGWSLADWLYWFDPFSDVRRSWQWWSSGVDDDDWFWIDIDVLEDPGALGTLEWLMLANGASHVHFQDNPPYERRRNTSFAYSTSSKPKTSSTSPGPAPSVTSSPQRSALTSTVSEQATATASASCSSSSRPRALWTTSEATSAGTPNTPTPPTSSTASLR